MITANVFGSRCGNTTVFAALYFLVWQVSPPPPASDPQGNPCMDEIHERATQASSSHYTTQRLVQLNSEWKWWRPFLPPPVQKGRRMEEWGGGVVVVNVRPWEEEHGKARPAMDVASKLNRSLEDRMMSFWKPQPLICDTVLYDTHTETRLKSWFCWVSWIITAKSINHIWRIPCLTIDPPNFYSLEHQTKRFPQFNVEKFGWPEICAVF